MNTRIDDALDVIEFSTQHEFTERCKKQEATLQGYMTKMSNKLKRVIEKTIARADKRNETAVGRTHCTDRLLLCFGERISGATVMAYPKGAVYVHIDWAVFIRDHKLHPITNHQLALQLNDLLPGYRTFSHGETFKHEYEFVLVKRSKESA
jgi:hypothetical protein